MSTNITKLNSEGLPTLKRGTIWSVVRAYSFRRGPTHFKKGLSTSTRSYPLQRGSIMYFKEGLRSSKEGRGPGLHTKEGLCWIIRGEGQRVVCKEGLRTLKRAYTFQRGPRYFKEGIYAYMYYIYTSKRPSCFKEDLYTSKRAYVEQWGARTNIYCISKRAQEHFKARRSSKRLYLYICTSKRAYVIQRRAYIQMFCLAAS